MFLVKVGLIAFILTPLPRHPDPVTAGGFQVTRIEGRLQFADVDFFKKLPCYLALLGLNPVQGIENALVSIVFLF